MDENPAVERADLREYLRVLSRRRLVIALTVVIVLGLALAYSFARKPIYSASATVLVPQQQASSDLNIQNSQLPAAASLQRSLSDEQQFAEGDAVKRTATHALGFQARVSVSSSSTADVLTFTAHSENKAAAATIANAFANAYITARRANQVAQYTQQVTALQSSIANLQAQASTLSANNPQRAALEQSIGTLTQSVQQTQAAAQLAIQVEPSVINAAVIPSTPISPKPVRNAILGALVGLIIGIGLAFLVERFDDGINSRDDAVRATDGLPIVGLVPMVDAWRAKGSHHIALLENPNSTVAEAYRTVRTSIQFLGIDEPKHVLGMTSSVPDEGKTTAVANLAVSFARAGQRVIVVSCDLRRPRIHEFFAIPNATGLTSVLIGESSLTDALHVIDGEPNLRVLPSGPVPPNPAEILSLDRVRQVVDALAANSDVVLLDCPPVLPVTDTLLLSRLADGMLILASAKSTSRRDLHRTFELLNQVRAPVLGTVLNRVPTEGGYAYGYGYGDGYYGYYELDSAASDRLVNGGTPPLPLRNGSPHSRTEKAEVSQAPTTKPDASHGPES